MQEKQTTLEESISKTRDTVYSIFFVVALLEVPIVLYSVWMLFSWSLGWLGVLLFVVWVTLTICFLMVVNWVAEDKKTISLLSERVQELEQERNLK